MASEVYIEKPTGEISHTEWVDAISTAEGVRLEGNPQILKNPRTGEIITLGGNSNNAAVKFMPSKFLGIGEEQWIVCLFFNKGKAAFKVTPELELINHPLRRVVSSLIKKLDANLIDHEGNPFSW